MKTEAEIKARITEIEKSCAHVLTGSYATVGINAPRALMQCRAESQLEQLYWMIGKRYKSKLRGTDT